MVTSSVDDFLNHNSYSYKHVACRVELNKDCGKDIKVTQ